MNPNILRDTLASVLVELERLDPQSLVAARAQGVLAAFAPPERPAPYRKPPKSHRPLIIKQRDQDIADAYSSGLTMKQVADKLGCGHHVVQYTLKKLNAPTRKPGTTWSPSKVTVANEARIERIREMRAQGKTLEEIGAVERVTRERIRQLCVKAGIATPRPELSPVELEAVARYVAGDSLELAASSISRSTHSMKRMIAQAGHSIRPAPKQRNLNARTIQNAERVAALYQQGLTCREIAERVGFKKPEQIYRLLAIAGLKANRQRYHVVPALAGERSMAAA